MKFSSQWYVLYKVSTRSGFTKLIMPYLVYLITDMYVLFVNFAAASYLYCV